MYGNYANMDNEDESASESFSIASLVTSTKKHKRRMGTVGQSTSGYGKPVRLGRSVQKPTMSTQRFLAVNAGVGYEEFQRKLSDIADDEDHFVDGGVGVSSDQLIKNESLSNALETMSLNSPRGRSDEKENTCPSIVLTDVDEQPKLCSGDSGSFSMTQPETKVRDDKGRRSLQNSDSGQYIPLQGLNVPYSDNVQKKPNFGAPVKMSSLLGTQSGTVVDTLKKENIDVSGGAKSKQVVDLKVNRGINERRQYDSYRYETSIPLSSNNGIIPNAGSHQYNPVPMPSTPMPPPGMLPPAPVRSSDQYLEVRGKKYTVMKLLGKGGSSRVYEAFDEEKKIVVAIKRVDLSQADEAQTEGYVNEIEMLRRLQGEDRIVKLYDHEKVDSEEMLYVIMEKGDTDLASLLKKYSSKQEITPAMIKHYWTEMLHAVSVIHKRGIIHKDLKPANFLLVAGRLKLIDFGIASSVQSDMTSVCIDSQMGTFNYMSPESIQDLNGPRYDAGGNRKPCIKISFKSDVWSLGCILYQLVYGKMPFGDVKHPLMKLQAITNTEHPIPFPELPSSDPSLILVIKSCLKRDPKLRPSIEELLGHAYVTGEQLKDDKQLDHLSAVKMLAALEGVLSPETFNKTREGLTETFKKNDDSS